ncbi:hypothetical protein HDV00_005391 [Rhizophlyctis rosea]|nr:hypothetical protein HDV00_005391 [Rhizophlyctis rosea]
MILDNILLHCTILPKYVRIVNDTTADATQNDPKEQLNFNIYLDVVRFLQYELYMLSFLKSSINLPSPQPPHRGRGDYRKEDSGTVTKLDNLSV